MTSSGLSFINRSICFQLSLFAIRLDNPTVPICWLICDGLAPALLDTLDNYWHAMYLLLWEWRGEDQSDYYCDSSTEQPHWERLEGIINSHLICTKPQDMITNVESLPGYCHKNTFPASACNTSPPFSILLSSRAKALDVGIASLCSAIGYRWCTCFTDSLWSDTIECLLNLVSWMQFPPLSSVQLKDRVRNFLRPYQNRSGTSVLLGANVSQKKEHPPA